MSNEKENKEQELENVVAENATAENAEQATQEAAELSVEEKQAQEIAELQKKVAELEDKNLRMMAEFENYRRRTQKEKLDLMAAAGEKILTDMLPLVDDFERSLAAIAQTDDKKSLEEGVALIYKNFLNFLDKNNVHAIDTKDADFNTDEHEAITTIAMGEEMKGKVYDCTKKGYKLGEKVIRFAQVVVGA